jgi:hypothetical protein
MSLEPKGLVLAEGLNFPEGPAFDPSGSLGLVVTEAETGVLISYSMPHKPALF